MTKPAELAPAPHAKVGRVHYGVPFYDTDGMRIVHHANYARYFELGRVRLLAEHDLPYGEYIARGMHFVVTSLSIDFHRAAHFEDLLEITCWVVWVKGVSLRLAYRITRDDECLVTGTTTHAMVDAEGRPTRIPPDRRQRLSSLIGGSTRRPPR